MPRVQLADLLEPDNLGPEAVRLLKVADIEHQVIDASGAYRFGRGRRDIGTSIGHRKRSQIAVGIMDTSLKMGRASPPGKLPG
jgi:hypothetical protein